MNLKGHLHFVGIGIELTFFFGLNHSTVHGGEPGLDRTRQRFPNGSRAVVKFDRTTDEERQLE